MSHPALTLTLTPQLEPATPPRIRVSYVVEAPALEAGQTLCRLPIVIVGIPGAPLAARDLTVADDAGPLELDQRDEPPTPTSTYRHWMTMRATVGDVRVDYFAPVRKVDESTLNGPLFDLREEAGGLCGAGVTFLALPDTAHAYDVTLRWDLSNAPAGARGVSSLGEGTVRSTETAEDLAYAFYVAGLLHTYPEDTSGTFAMYWLSEPSFDPIAVAERTQRVYDAMCRFFQEPSPGFRVFVRKHPYPGAGGTALRRSFMFGYSALASPTIETLTALIAHETAHNWPRLDGEHGETAWYTEGTAEYYSIVLPHRAGIITDTHYLERINERARSYYTNPLQTLTNQEAAARFWQDPRAQRIPYGRGLFYFIDLNAKVRARTNGTRSVDDLVLEVLARQRAGQQVGVPEWIKLVVAELGESAQRDFEALIAGHWVVPAPDALGPQFVGRQITDVTLDLGFDTASLASRTISGVVPGSAAERAGIREGDYLVRIPNLSDLEYAPRAEIEVRLRRGGSDFSVRYTPAGPPVRSYEWILQAPRTDGLGRTANDSPPPVWQRPYRWLRARCARRTP
jgi:hypothetical protein